MASNRLTALIRALGVPHMDFPKFDRKFENVQELTR